jgi:hypothetical protein
MARLPKGAETTISMAFLVMCAEKILRLVCLFFVAFYAWIYACQPLGWLSLALGSISAHSSQPSHPMLHNIDFELLSPLLRCCTQAALANCFSGAPK